MWRTQPHVTWACCVHATSPDDLRMLLTHHLAECARSFSSLSTPSNGNRLCQNSRNTLSLVARGAGHIHTPSLLVVRVCTCGGGVSTLTTSRRGLWIRPHNRKTGPLSSTHPSTHPSTHTYTGHTTVRSEVDDAGQCQRMGVMHLGSSFCQPHCLAAARSHFCARCACRKA